MVTTDRREVVAGVKKSRREEQRERRLNELRSRTQRFVEAVRRIDPTRLFPFGIDVERLREGLLVRKALEMAADWGARSPLDHEAAALGDAARAFVNEIAWGLSPTQATGLAWIALRTYREPRKATRAALFERGLIDSSLSDGKLTDLGRVVFRALGGRDHAAA